MKKRLFLSTIVSFLLFLPSLAQDTRLGIKAGANVSNVNNTVYMYVNKSKIGYHGGVMAHITIAKHLAIQPELLYSLAGDEAEIYDRHPDFVSGRLKTHLHYITLPLAMKYYPYKGLNLQFGFQPGLLIQAKEKGEAGGSMRWTPRNQDVTKYYNRFDAALLAGLGLDFKSGLTFDTRLLYSITDMYKPDAGLDVIRDRTYELRNEESKPVRNIVLQFSAGYIFNK